MFLIPALYILEKISLSANIRNKCVIRKINLYFYEVIKMAKCFLQKFVIFIMIPDSFLIEKCGTLEVTRR